jgi:hypothetical protein
MRQETVDKLEQALRDIKEAAQMVNDDTNSVLAGRDHLELVVHFDKLRTANEDVKQARKALDIMSDRLSHSEIPDRFRELRIKTITVEGVGRVSIGHRWSCSIIDKQVGFQYLREQGDGGLIIETVNAQTLAAHAKDLVENQGKELPADKFKTSLMPYTSITSIK